MPLTIRIATKDELKLFIKKHTTSKMDLLLYIIARSVKNADYARSVLDESDEKKLTDIVLKLNVHHKLLEDYLPEANTRSHS